MEERFSPVQGVLTDRLKTGLGKAWCVLWTINC